MEQMEPTKVQAKVRIPRAKFNGINAVADERGIIAAAAMDQRGSLRKAIAKAQRSEVSEPLHTSGFLRFGLVLY